MARDPYASPEVESAVLDIEESFRAAFRKIAIQLRKLVRHIKAGQGVRYSDAVVAAKIRALIFELEHEMNAAGFGDVLKGQRAALKRLSKSVLDEATGLGLPSIFSDAEKGQIDLLRDGAHHKLIMLRHKAASELEEILIRSATANVDVDDVVHAISRRLDITETQARTEAEKTIAAFHTQVRTEHADKAGVKWFLYRGPLDDRTRLFCAHFAGTRVTIAILEKHAGSYDRNPGRVPVAALLGDYHCRHELVPLPDPKTWKQYPIGPR